jgi:small subunit ribosomal protein S13
MSDNLLIFKKQNFGVGSSLINSCKKTIGFNLNKPLKFSKKDQKKKQELYFSSFTLNVNLKKQKFEDISFQKKIKSYRGDRHKLRYPCRGQRTHTNAKTVKKIK